MSDETTPPRTRIRRRRAWTLVGIACAMGLLTYATYFFMDAPPVDDRDLTEITQLPLVDPAQNIAEALGQLTALVDEAKSDSFEEVSSALEALALGTALDPGDTPESIIAAAQDYFTAHTEMAETLRKALSRPSFVPPRAGAGLSSDTQYLLDYSRLAGWLEAHNRWALATRNADGIAADCRLLLHLGAEIARHPEGLMQVLVAHNIIRKGVAQTQQWLARGSVTPEEVELLRAELSRFPELCESLSHAHSREYALVAHTFTATIPNQLFSFRRNKTQRKLAARFRLLRDSVSLPLSEWRDTDLGQTSGRTPRHERWLHLLSGNSAGEMLLAMNVGPMSTVQERHCGTLAFVRALDTALAIRQYRLRKNGVPQNLDQLVPELLAAIPVDPCDGKPLRYSPEARRVYSVGIDLIDSGGSDAFDDIEPTVQSGPKNEREG